MRYIYFVRCVNSNAIKIGISKGPDGRVKGLETGNPWGLELVHTVPGSPRDEAWLHERFSHLKTKEKGEWFHKKELWGDDLIELYDSIIRAGKVPTPPDWKRPKEIHPEQKKSKRPLKTNPIRQSSAPNPIPPNRETPGQRGEDWCRNMLNIGNRGMDSREFIHDLVIDLEHLDRESNPETAGRLGINSVLFGAYGLFNISCKETAKAKMERWIDGVTCGIAWHQLRFPEVWREFMKDKDEYGPRMTDTHYCRLVTLMDNVLELITWPLWWSRGENIESRILNLECAIRRCDQGRLLPEIGTRATQWLDTHSLEASSEIEHLQPALIG